MKIESNKNWTTCLRLNTGDGSPRVFLLNSHFLGSVPNSLLVFFVSIKERMKTSSLIYFLLCLETPIRLIALLKAIFARSTSL